MGSEEKATFEAWVQQLHSEIDADRSDAADDPPEDAEPQAIVAALIPMLNDRKSLVRLCAVQSLGRYDDPWAAVAIREFLRRESDAIARSYAFESLGRVGEGVDIAFFAAALSRELTDKERIKVLLGFALLLRRLAVQEIASFLQSEALDVRTTAATALAEVLCSPEPTEILAALREQLSKEKTVNSRSHFEAIIRRIEFS